MQAANKLKQSKSMRIISMTGFAQGCLRSKELELEIEIKSLNNRFLDVVLRMPRAYSTFEAQLKKCVQEHFSRGRVEINITRNFRIALKQMVVFNKELFQTMYSAAWHQLKARGTDSVILANELTLNLLQRKEILGFSEDLDLLKGEQALVEKALRQTLGKLNLMREHEGSALARDLEQRFKSLNRLNKKIAELGTENAQQKKQRLIIRLKALSPEVSIDPARLLSEAAVIADRIDITEELVRISSHLQQCSVAMKSSPNGRKLDFLVQELGREFNTIGSKAQDAQIQTLVVEAKLELEKIKEQVQNIE